MFCILYQDFGKRFWGSTPASFQRCWKIRICGFIRLPFLQYKEILYRKREGWKEFLKFSRLEKIDCRCQRSFRWMQNSFKNERLMIFKIWNHLERFLIFGIFSSSNLSTGVLSLSLQWGYYSRAWISLICFSTFSRALER